MRVCREARRPSEVQRERRACEKVVSPLETGMVNGQPKEEMEADAAQRMKHLLTGAQM